jgi:hypothetical protein
LRKGNKLQYNTVVPTLFDISGSNEPKEKKSKAAKSGKTRMSGSPLRTKMRLFTSYAVNPDGIRFETQEEKETIVLFLRQHVIVNVPWILLAFIMIIAPTVVLPLVFGLMKIPVEVPRAYIFVGTIFWYVATFGFILAKFLGWFINIYIVTNQRIVDIDFYYLLNKHFAQAELNKVQDISYCTKGILSTVFNYGNVLIQTASELPNLDFDKVPNPEQVVETIRSLTEKHKNAHKP